MEPVRAPEPRRALGVVAGLVLLLASACAAGADPLPPVSPRAVASPSARPGGSGSVTAGPVPNDGVSLQSLGYVNGPAREFSLPRTAVLQAAVDQANNVTAVLAQPPPVDVADYLRRTLPATGFTVTADDPAALTLTFTGHGWTGSFTASEATSAVLLRPV